MMTVGKTLIFFLSFFIVASCNQNQTLFKHATAGVQTDLQKLLTGNIRFSNLKPVHPDEDREHLKDAAKSQHPFAVIVTCADSRVSPELVFDQGVGDFFVIRNAGNIIGNLEIGSIEYAVEHLGVKLIVIMGHENCGAVTALVQNAEAHGYIKDIVDSLKQEEEITAIPVNDTNRLDDCVKANVLHGIKQLRLRSKIIREKLDKKELQIVGMRYDLDDLKATVIQQ